ncbi:MAG: RagB/SusD family nutrient uptake outer membrane protein, partial [Pedobacter sp.]
MIMKYIFRTTVVVIALLGLNSCKKYLDIVPDNVATIENAFTMRTQAQKYLFTCYSYLPMESDLADDPAMLGGDEMWNVPTRGGYFGIARGIQTKISPLGDRWVNLYRGLRDCNIFLENIGLVPDMDSSEKARWIAEVKFLKAYYHFYLMRMYGPIPMVKNNLPIDANVEQVKVSRDPVDSCFKYIVGLLDEANVDLPLVLTNPSAEAGRITRPVALSLKAKILVTAASPLFNGNTDQSTLKNKDGQQLFNQTFLKVKWDSAAVACKDAIDICNQAGIQLYTFVPGITQANLSQTIRTQMSIRNAFAEKWNSEIIWANTQTISATTNLQRSAGTWWDPAQLDGVVVKGEFSPPLKIVEMFYTKNGVPINEDKTYNYNGRYSLRTAVDGEKLYIKKDFT